MTNDRSAMTDYGGTWQQGADGERTVSFGPPAPEYHALHQGAALAPLVDRTQIELTGRDRAAFLHGFCTNDIRNLAPGQGREAFVCSISGKLLGHVLVFCEADSLLLETVPGQAEKLIRHLDRYLIREQVEFIDRSHSFCELLLAGPRAESLLDEAAGNSLPPEPLAHVIMAVNGVPVRARRVGFVRPPAFLLCIAQADAAAVWNALRGAGAVSCGWQALEAARIEAGWPWYGQDMNDDSLPQEVARDSQAISFVKGCYLGQETVARIDALGHVNRELRKVLFAGSTPPARGAAVYETGQERVQEQDKTAGNQADETAGREGGDQAVKGAGEESGKVTGKAIGTITSAAYSPGLGAAVGLALLRRGYQQPGQQLQTAAGPAKVVREFGE